MNKIDVKNLYKEYSEGDISKILASDSFMGKYHFHGELGVLYSKEKSIFRIWSPVAKNIYLEVFKREKDRSFKLLHNEKMHDLNGIFEFEIDDNLDGMYYKYKVSIDDNIYDVVDPYAKSTCENGEYGYIINLENVKPEKWDEDKNVFLDSVSDTILYETHIRDFTIDKNSGVLNKGKFLGLAEEGTKYKGMHTGISHLKELGVTHVHLLPVYDYKTVDETTYDEKEYNWGYDPDNYNTLEGSYCTNPYSGENRVLEFREMIMKFHKNNIGVVLDLVYNHTYEGKNSKFNKIVPYYYYREEDDGKFSNGSGCGNELATERSMVRKYIIDSILFYAKEYHIDGFRFDLMGLYDIKTIKDIREELDKIDKKIIIYGEGWTGGYSPLDERKRCVKNNTRLYDNMQIAAFNDGLRDGIKGHTFNAREKGFVGGVPYFNEAIKSGIVGGIKLDGILDGGFTNEPYQCINYESAHDNYTLFDKIKISNEELEIKDIINLNKLAFSMVILSQGIPFIHSGEEFLRSKKNRDGSFVENSYKSEDYVNSIKWENKVKYKDVFNFYKEMIDFRKNHKAFRLGSALEIKKRVRFIDGTEAMIIYSIDATGIDDEFKSFIVLFNGNDYDLEVSLEENKEFKVLIEDNKIIKMKREKIKDRVYIKRKRVYVLGEV